MVQIIQASLGMKENNQGSAFPCTVGCEMYPFDDGARLRGTNALYLAVKNKHHLHGTSSDTMYTDIINSMIYVYIYIYIYINKHSGSNNAQSVLFNFLRGRSFIFLSVFFLCSSSVFLFHRFLSVHVGFLLWPAGPRELPS